MNFDIPTAMQLTATMTSLVGIALAFAMTGYPRTLRNAIRLWVRGLLLQPIAFVLFSLRGSIPDWLSIVLANAVLVVSFAHFVLALRTYRGRPGVHRPLLFLIAVALIGEILLTYAWPNLHGRIMLISVILSIMSVVGVHALYRHHEVATRPEHMVAFMLVVGIVILMARALQLPDPNVAELTSSTPLQGIVFTYASLLPVIATSGFLLMCGERLNKDLARLAMFDPLTGVYNRRTMTELASRAIAASKRHGRALSLLVLDIDHFKRINDQFGHEAGDLALCRVVELVSAELRVSDILARMGSEEFVVILADTGENQRWRWPSDPRAPVRRRVHHQRMAGRPASVDRRRVPGAGNQRPGVLVAAYRSRDVRGEARRAQPRRDSFATRTVRHGSPCRHRRIARRQRRTQHAGLPLRRPTCHRSAIAQFAMRDRDR